MPAKRKSLAEQLAEAANPEPVDVDPEDYENQDQYSGSESESDSDHDQTSHYVDVGKSKLRDDGIELSDAKYKGARVSRQDLEQDTNDESELEGSSDEEPSGASGSDDAESENEQETAERSNSKGISQILSAEQKHLLSRLSTEKEGDVEKGKAVSAQIKVYEHLLDMRIQTQKILNSSNTLSTGSSQSASPLLPLIGEVLKLRQTLAGTPESDNGSSVDASSLEELAQKNKSLDEELTRKRESTLTKWSRKVELSSGKNALQSNRFRSLGQSAALQVNTVLGDMERLEKRTKVDRSNYGLDESHPWLFDDTDFYRLLLKDLVDRRMADTNATNSLKWKTAASVSKQKKKNVDTKASKGRKLRYNVIDKIQGFDAPRKVFTWSDKQAEDLYSGLLGVQISMDDAEPRESEGEGSDVENVKVTEDFNLFG